MFYSVLCVRHFCIDNLLVVCLEMKLNASLHKCILNMSMYFVFGIKNSTTYLTDSTVGGYIDVVVRVTCMRSNSGDSGFCLVFVLCLFFGSLYRVSSCCHHRNLIAIITNIRKHIRLSAVEQCDGLSFEPSLTWRKRPKPRSGIIQELIVSLFHACLWAWT